MQIKKLKFKFDKRVNNIDGDPIDLYKAKIAKYSFMIKHNIRIDNHFCIIDNQDWSEAKLECFDAKSYNTACSKMQKWFDKEIGKYLTK